MIKIKDIFTSRFGDNGVIVQADFSQLEIRVLAYLSQDETLIQEFNDDVDIHLNNAREWKRDPNLDKKTEEGAKIRTAAKAMTFQMTYGAGAKRMSDELDIPFEEAKAFIRAFYERYPKVKEWHEKIINDVRNNQMGSWSYLQGPSGRIWWFEEKPTNIKFLNDKGIFSSINPAQVKDLPVQGSASDIVIIQRGILVRKLLQYLNKCFIINTVHDSVMLDCHLSVKDEVVTIMKEVMEDVSTINKVFDKPFNVPLKVDISWGSSWGNLKESDD